MLGKRFAAEAEGGQAIEVLERRQLRGRVPLHRERQVGGGDAAAVVDDLDQLDAAALDRDADAGRAGVDGVLDQLLDDRDRALDHLAGGDLADGSFVEQAKRSSRRPRMACDWGVQGAMRGLS